MKFITAVGCFLAISSPHGSDAGTVAERTTYTGPLFGFGGRRSSGDTTRRKSSGSVAGDTVGVGSVLGLRFGGGDDNESIVSKLTMGN